MNSLVCIVLNLFFGLPQGFFDFVFGIFGQTAPDLAAGIGSIFGCNL